MLRSRSTARSGAALIAATATLALTAGIALAHPESGAITPRAASSPPSRQHPGGRRLHRRGQLRRRIDLRPAGADATPDFDAEPDRRRHRAIRSASRSPRPAALATSRSSGSSTVPSAATPTTSPSRPPCRTRPLKHGPTRRRRSPACSCSGRPSRSDALDWRPVGPDARVGAWDDEPPNWSESSLRASSRRS